MSAVDDGPPPVSVRMISDALLALGAYAGAPPSEGDLVAAEAREGAGLGARLANALYGCALAQVMTAEVAATGSTSTGYRGAAWTATGGDPEGTAILLHYSAMRLASDLQAVLRQLPVDLGVMGAAAGAAQALKLLLEVTTVRSLSDPRAEQVSTNLARAQDELATAHQHLADLFAAGRDAAALIQNPQ